MVIKNTPSRNTNKTAQLKRAVGRPRDLSKTEAIVDAAWDLFLAKGVAAVTMEAIAANAHVSKGTLYACYADKSELFEAAVKREMKRIEAAQGISPPADITQPLAETLTRFGTGILRFLASPPAVSFYNALSAELRQHPALAQAFWDLGPGKTRANLAAVLEVAAKRGEIAVDDPLAAAEILFGLWQGFSPMQLALGLAPHDTETWINNRVRRGVSLFMQAHQITPIGKRKNHVKSPAVK